MADKPRRDPKPRGTLRVVIVREEEANEALEQLNSATKADTEWRQDKATRRARRLAETGWAHLCQFAKKQKKKKKTDESTDPSANKEGSADTDSK